MISPERLFDVDLGQAKSHLSQKCMGQNTAVSLAVSVNGENQLIHAGTLKFIPRQRASLSRLARREIEDWYRSTEHHLADAIETIRTDLQSLASSVGRIANKQIGRAQVRATEAAHEAEVAITRNPLTAIAIAVGLGFLLGVLTRR